MYAIHIKDLVNILLELWSWEYSRSMVKCILYLAYYSSTTHVLLTNSFFILPVHTQIRLELMDKWKKLCKSNLISQKALVFIAVRVDFRFDYENYDFIMKGISLTFVVQRNFFFVFLFHFQCLSIIYC